MLFNQDVIAYRQSRPRHTINFNTKKRRCDEIIFVFRGSGVMESVFGKLPYRAEDYIVIRAGLRTDSCQTKLKRRIISFSNRSVLFGFRNGYLNHEGQIKMGAPYSERDSTVSAK